MLIFSVETSVVNTCAGDNVTYVPPFRKRVGMANPVFRMYFDYVPAGLDFSILPTDTPRPSYFNGDGYTMNNFFEPIFNASSVLQGNTNSSELFFS